MCGKALIPWLLAVLSAILLELPFPMAGAMPAWRGLIAWIAIVPLLAALLNFEADGCSTPPLKGALLGWLAGTLWVAGNCYWVYTTVRTYCGMAPVVSGLIMLAFSLILGSCFAVFGFLLTFVRRRFRRPGIALLAAPVLWVAVDFLSTHLTSISSDQLGYSQVENEWLNWLAAWTGVYGVTFLLILGNAAVTSLFLPGFKRFPKRVWQARAMMLAVLLLLCAMEIAPFSHPPPESPVSTEATLIQPNLDVGIKEGVDGAVSQRDLGTIDRLGRTPCREYVAGIPETGHPLEPCYAGEARVIVWPEVPSPLRDLDPRFRNIVSRLASATRATVIAGSVGQDAVRTSGRGEARIRVYNSASVVAPNGDIVGRYDKVHLLPFGEYTPYKRLLFFVGYVTRNASGFEPGHLRKVFMTDGHRYSVFICYEAMFGGEVRQFVKSGAEALVNISDDGWFDDTSAPWQHLDVTRMRAIENHRWILRDTNNGVTAIIDPRGRITASIPRHMAGVLTAPFDYERDITFYTSHGDLFAGACAALTLLLLLPALLIGARARLSRFLPITWPKSGRGLTFRPSEQSKWRVQCALAAASRRLRGKQRSEI